MTVNYAQEVATERVGGFFRMLFRYRGSIYRAIYGEIAIFLLLYYVLFGSYYLLPNSEKNKFAEFCKSCEDFADYIPVTFIVGFYTVRVISRRWTQWENIPWPDKCVFNISGNLHGTDVQSRMLRRTIARYVNLGSILCYRDISIPVKKRFPSLEYLINAGLMTPEEVKLYEETSCKTDTNWWIPFHWAFMLVERVKQEDRIDGGQMNKIRDDILDLRQKCWVLFSHDWIPIPMVYTQVVTLAVYIFMLACLFGRQSFASLPLIPLDENGALLNGTAAAMIASGSSVKKHAEYYFPFFTVCQVMFYLGWLKVAEILINPMGLDDDDFEMNYIIDRNMRVSYTVVDYSYNKLPPVEKDIHWDAEEPDIPHTVASAKAGTAAFIGSAANVSVSNKQAGISEQAPHTHGVSPSAANGSVAPSRQTSANVPGTSSPVVQPPVYSKSEKHVPALLRPISRLFSKDNEILDGVKQPPQATASSPALKHRKSKKEANVVKVDQDVPLQTLEPTTIETGQPPPFERTSRPQSVVEARLAKIDESGEVLIQLLNESEQQKRTESEEQQREKESLFYLHEDKTPPPKPPRPQFPSSMDGGADEPDGSSRIRSTSPRPPLPHQQRNLPSVDDPPTNTKEPPTTL